MFTVDGGLPPDLVIHSTSWRYEAPTDSLLLTYLVHSDDMDLAAFELESDRIPLAEFENVPAHPSASSDPDVHVRDVVKHAIRHLAFLVENSPALGAVFGPKPEMAVLRQINQTVAFDLTPIERAELEPEIELS